MAIRNFVYLCIKLNLLYILLVSLFAHLLCKKRWAAATSLAVAAGCLLVIYRYPSANMILGQLIAARG
jgi:hypothetical protein